MKKLKVLDLFSGIAGFSYALDKVEVDGNKVFETVAFCEIDADCHRVLNRHWPDTFKAWDINHLKYQDGKLLYTPQSLSSTKSLEGAIDVIVGGFPCTDISTAGHQKGLVDEELLRKLTEEGMCREDAERQARTRSGLWFEYKRLIQEIRPKWVIIENVRNLLSNGFADFLKDISEIGFSCEWEVISARDVGAPHLRERIWIVAYPNCESVRDESEWAEGRRLNFSSSRETEFGYSSKDGQIESSDSGDQHNPKFLDERGEDYFTDPDSEGLEGFGDSIRVSEEHLPSNGSDTLPSHTDNFRFWPSFATEEEKSEWWAKATFEHRYWWATQSDLRGVYARPSDFIYNAFSSGGLIEVCKDRVWFKSLLCLWKGVSEEEVWETVRGSQSISVEKDLWEVLWEVKATSEHVGLLQEGFKLEKGLLRNLWSANEIALAPQRPKCCEQHLREYDDFMSILSSKTPLEDEARRLGGWEEALHPDKVRRARIKQLGNGIVPPIAQIIGERIAYHEHNAEAQL